MDYKSKYNDYLNLFEDYLSKTEGGLGNLKIAESMKYSLNAGGKRIRSVLLLAFTEIFGGNIQDALPFALAIECVHTYSLIHDDLPAMDNDDFRRGKPSNHKVFGEAGAILAGDALLTYAFEHTLKLVNNLNQVKALAVLAEYAGYNGMIGGQSLDVDGGKDKEDLAYIVENKTSKLLTAPLLMASYLCESPYYEELKNLGFYLGFLFQTVDDILDVIGDSKLLGKSVGKDAIEDKLTCVKLYGLDGARELATKYHKKCLDILKDIPNTEFIEILINNLLSRSF